jgi:hypothetical protein
LYPEEVPEMLAKQAAIGMDSPPDIRKSLNTARVNAAREMDRIDKLLELLDRNPDVTEIIQLLGRRYL